MFSARKIKIFYNFYYFCGYHRYRKYGLCIEQIALKLKKERNASEVCSFSLKRKTSHHENSFPLVKRNKNISETLHSFSNFDAQIVNR